MKLPNAANAVVEREKIADYLLNPAHRYGASKRGFSPTSAFASRHGGNWHRRCASTGRPMT